MLSHLPLIWGRVHARGVVRACVQQLQTRNRVVTYITRSTGQTGCSTEINKLNAGQRTQSRTTTLPSCAWLRSAMRPCMRCAHRVDI